MKMKAILILLVTLMLLGNLNAQWQTNSIDTISTGVNSNSTGRLSIISDNSGVQHAAWMEALPGFMGNRIFYSMKPSGNTWTTPVPVTDAGTGVYGSYIGVNKITGKVFVTYIKDVSSVGQVFIATQVGSNFVETQVTTGGNDKYSPSIKIDNDGNAHLAWVSQNANNDYKIYYANNIGNVFSIDELIGSNPGEFGSGASPYIEVSSTGVAYISFRSGGFSDYKISVAFNNESGGALWTYETLITPNTSDYDGMMEFDAAGTLHILISGADDSIFPAPRQVYYMKKPAGQPWGTPQLVSISSQAIGGSLKVENNGDVHIVMNQASGNFILGTIIYVNNKSGSWQESIVINDDEAYAPNISLDNLGKGYIIAYQGEWGSEDIIVVSSQNSLTKIETVSGEVPSTFSLMQNYPNPFNPSTTIKFDLARTGFASLKVYNSLGKEVASLLHRELIAGTYEYFFDASNLSSGVYYYRLESNGSVLTRKMTLMK